MPKFLTFLILVSHWSFGQVLQNGLILPTAANTENSCCIYSPEVGFTVYENPRGLIVGKLTRDVSKNQSDQSAYEIYFVDISTKTKTKLDLVNFREVDYEIWSITYFERRDGFVRVVNENSNYWLNEAEIQKLGFAVVEWQAFLSNSKNLMGFSANDPGLNLREGPTKEARIIKTLRGDLYEISPTNEHNGLWTKVKIVKRKEHPCETTLTEKDNIEYELEGWIKIVDDSGQPNVGYNARGC